MKRVSFVLAIFSALVLAACAAQEGAQSDSTSGEDSDMLSVGAQAPGFTAKTHEGETVSLEDYKGEKNVVLIFYPKNKTPGCTKQLCTARDDYSQYNDVDAAVFGVNPADADAHQSFVDKYDFPFPLLVDESMKIADAYGAKGLIPGVPKRTVVAIGKDGRVAFAERGMPSTSKIVAALR